MKESEKNEIVDQIIKLLGGLKNSEANAIIIEVHNLIGEVSIVRKS